jgi:hypothetical protein
MLTSLYRADGAATTASLCATTWDVMAARYVLHRATEIQLEHLRNRNDRHRAGTRRPAASHSHRNPHRNHAGAFRT